MRGRGRQDDGWDEGRRDSWQNGNAYPPDTAAGYQGHASQTGYGAYPDSRYPGQAAAGGGLSGAGYDSAGYSGGAGYAGDAGYPGGGYSGNGYNDAGAAGYANGYSQPGYPATGATGQYGRPASSAAAEFLPADESAAGNDNAAGTPRPYGRLSIFTLLDDKAAEFDRLAERAAEGVRTAEPDTLVYVIHVVPKAPMQRIIYEIYRDRAAFESHEQQPHIQRFVADRRSCVLATNIIDLRLKYAKVAALATAQGAEAAAAPAAPGFGQETHLDQVPASLGSADRYAANGYSAANGQYQSNDRYAAAGTGSYPQSGYAANGQYQATGQYSPAGTGQYAANDQYATSGTAQYAANDQYAAGGQYGNDQLSSSGQYSSEQYGSGQYSSGQYSNGQYSNGSYGSGQYTAAGDGGQQGSGRYPALGSGRQLEGGGRPAESGSYGQADGYGRTASYSQSGYAANDQDSGAEARTPRFEPATDRDRTASRAGRY